METLLDIGFSPCQMFMSYINFDVTGA